MATKQLGIATLNEALSYTSPRQSVRLDTPDHYFLSTFETADDVALHSLLTIRSISNCLIMVPEPYTLLDAQSWIAGIIASQASLLSIPTVAARHAAFFTQGNPLPMQVIRYDGKLVGAISHAPKDSKNGLVEMGYYLHPDHQGKGVMVAAGRALLSWATSEFGIRKVYSSADVHNVASGKVIEKLARETAKGEVVIGSEDLTWPREKMVVGRGVVSPSKSWSWSIGPNEA